MIAGVLALLGMAAAQDAQDMAFSNLAAVAPPGAVAPDYYLVQPGDTLWDISTRFLGDPYQWPALWSYNDYITNPHWIYPGNKIYFRLGTELEPPDVGLEEAPVEAPYQPEETPRPVAEERCDFPPRFAAERREVRVTVPVVLAARADLALKGKIYAADTGSMLLSENRLVSIKLDRGADVGCGDVLSVYRFQSKVKVKRTDYGGLWRVLAELRVIRVDGSVATAEVRDGAQEFERGDLVGQAHATDLVIDVHAPEGDVETDVVARMRKESRLIRPGEVIFLDRGTNDGLNPGSALYIVDRRDGRAVVEDKPDMALPERVMGRAVVVRAEETQSTAVIVDLAGDVPEAMHLVGTPNN
jgi:hypothetical protein